MPDELIKLVKENWMMIGTEVEQELLKTLSPEMKVQYQDTMLRLETDFEFQKELGIDY